jgi:hypothetical protein
MAVYDFTEYGASAGFMYKNTSMGYYFDGTTFTKIIDDDYPGVIPVTSITRASSTATLTSTTNHGLVTGDSVIISGATQTEYNGTFTVTVTGVTTFTYTVTGTPATPATGTPVCNQVDSTVPGVAYLDGYIFVMNPDAEIINSALEAPSNWNALDFITAEVEPSRGKGIAKQQNYIVAFCEHSTEFFYDAGNATGSPLSRMAQNASFVGCEDGYTIAYSAGTVFWVGKNKNRGRGVYRLNGLQPELVSTPAIDRILDTLGFTTVHAFGFRINGSHFYLLNAISDNLTLVFDVANNIWAQWTYTTAGTPITLTSLTQVNGLATATKTSHGFASGDLIRIAGATPSGYNVDVLISVIDANTFTFPVTSTLSTPATGTITATEYTAGYMPFVSYTYGGNQDLLLHESDGYVYELTPDVFQDLQTTSGYPIWSIARTDRIDGGDLSQKLFGNIEIVGDQMATFVFERHSNDDAQNWSAPKGIDMSLRSPQVRRLGRARRMVFEVHHIDNSRCRLESLEIGN